MKVFIYAVTTCLIFIATTPSFAQLRKIPAEVTESFTTKFPEATSVEWRDKLTGFTATFSVDSVTYIATFDNDGEWQSTEESIGEEDLPSAVQDGFEKSRYADWKVDNLSRIQLPGDEVNFKIVVVKGDIKKRNLLFNNEGRLLKDKLTL